VFEDVLASSQALFGADAAGLWLVEPGRHPFHLAAHRDLDPELNDAVARIVEDEESTGLQAIRGRHPIVVERTRAPGIVRARTIPADGSGRDYRRVRAEATFEYGEKPIALPARTR